MRTASNVPHPIPYQGSKRWLAPTVCGCIPKGIRTIYEPFAGSAAVSLYAAASESADSFVIGDLHKPIAGLWDAIIKAPHDLADEYERLWHEQPTLGKAHFNEVRKAFNQDPQPATFLYLLARCVKAAIRYNRNGEFNNTADHRRRGTRPDTMRDNIVRAAKILAGKSQVFNANYLDTLREADTSDVIYLDPPYQGTSGERDSRYVKGMSFSEFCDGLHGLAKRKLSLIISYDGRVGDKIYGQRLPDSLKLRMFEVKAGRSTQETLLGRNGVTYESLYVSECLLDRIERLPRLLAEPACPSQELLLF
ncbi:MAG: DNA adenine methylase [Pirellulaceae bacterium]